MSSNKYLPIFEFPFFKPTKTTRTKINGNTRENNYQYASFIFRARLEKKSPKNIGREIISVKTSPITDVILSALASASKLQNELKPTNKKAI